MKKINFLLLQVILFSFVFSLGAQTEIKDADGNTSVETERTANDDIIRFQTAGSTVFQMIGNRLEPINPQNSVWIGQNTGISNTGGNNVGLGYNSLNKNTTGSNNLGLGTNTLEENLTGYRNTAVGAAALQKNTSGSFNVGLGASTLQQNLVGSYNVAIGYISLEKNTSGNQNTAIGYASLKNTTTGSNNVGLGTNALAENLTGFSNAAIGGNALIKNIDGYQNAAIGYLSLQKNTSGKNNVGVGSSSNSENTIGDNNVGIGLNTNRMNQTGSNNTLIGSFAGGGATAHNKSGSVFIGYQAGFNETNSNKLYIENSSSTTPLILGDFSSDQVGINTDKLTSGYALSVNGKGIFTEVRVLEFANWPDYVFKPEYKLKTLEEVNSFIKENGHLPNIPSAEEVKEDGILLGDMNKNLLEKIEELTLYMIQTNEQIKELKSENVKLKKEVEALKNK